MVGLLARLVVFFALVSQLSATADVVRPMPPNYFANVAEQAVNATWRELSYCGLVVLRANDPRLPFPMVPAQLAVVNRYGRLLAYYNQNYGFGLQHEFKNPNGSYVHAAYSDSRGVQFVTPYAGTVAYANQVVSVGGAIVQFNCQGRPLISERDFQMCVRRTFVSVIAQQLCRFAY